MTKSLGMTGVLNPQSHPGLTGEAKEYLAEILHEKLKDRRKIAHVIEEIDYAVKTYRAAKALQESTSPAVVRKNVESTRKAALALGARLNALDGHSLWLLQHGTVDPVARMQSEISQLLQSLSRASKIAGQSNPRGGRLHDIPERLLVAQVAHLLKTETTIKTTASAGGMFEQIVEVLMAAIDGSPTPKPLADGDRSVHDLVLRALKVTVITDEGGTIVFDPGVE